MAERKVQSRFGHGGCTTFCPPDVKHLVLLEALVYYVHQQICLYILALFQCITV